LNEDDFKEIAAFDDSVCHVMISTDHEKVHNSGAPSAVWSVEGDNLPALGLFDIAA